MTTQSLPSHPPEFIKLLANDVRWALLKALTRSDQQVNELVTLLQQPMNLISYHLKKMRDDALVTTRRSEADGRDVYYSLDLERVRTLYLEAGAALHPSIGRALPSVDLSRLSPHRVLFVCTHNSARSQMAEGLLRHLGQDKIAVSSAGSQPTRIHPDAIHTMDQMGIDIREQQPRSLADLAEHPFDTVITVCDRAREICPTFPGQGRQLHWGFRDPVVIQDEQERRLAFQHIAGRLRTRIEYFLLSLMKESDH